MNANSSSQAVENPDTATALVLTMGEAASRAGISRSLLFDLCRRGIGPRTMKIGGRRLVRPEALAEWLRELERQCAEGQTAPRAIPVILNEGDQ